MSCAEFDVGESKYGPQGKEEMIFTRPLIKRGRRNLVAAAPQKIDRRPKILYLAGSFGSVKKGSSNFFLELAKNFGSIR